MASVKKLYQEPGAHQLFVRICICIWAQTSLKPIYIFKSEHQYLPYSFSIFPRDTFFRIRGNLGRFPFGQKFRKFRFGAKWKTFFRFARLENSQKKWNCSKGSPVFPVGTFTEFLVFIISSMPFAVF